MKGEKYMNLKEINMNDTLIFVIIISGISILLGTIFLLIGIAMLSNRKKKEINCTSSTYGKVTDIVKHERYDSDGNHRSSWHPVFEYNIGDFKFIKEYPYGSSQSKYAIGQDVEIYYNPENYNEYYIAGDTFPKTLSIIFTIVGICIIIIDIVIAVTMLQIN